MRIVIEKYNPAWPAAYEREKAALLTAIGPQADEIIADIHHVGSTSVPRLAAKPIIDIQIGVYSLRASDPVCIPAITGLGYEYIKVFEEDTPFRRFFRKDSAKGVRTHHIHLVEVDSDWHRRHIAFRDYLCAHPEVRDAYAQYKYKLAEQEWETGSDYAEAKTPFIQPVEAQALAWVRQKQQAQIHIAEVDPETIHYINRVAGTIFVKSRLALTAADGKITAAEVEDIEPYIKPNLADGQNFSAYIGNPDQTVFLGFVNEDLAGQLIIRKNWNGYAYIEDIAIDKRFRRCGVGKALMEQAIAWAKAKALAGIMLEAQDVNVAAARFYAAMRFQIGGFDRLLYSAIPKVAHEIAIYWYLRFDEVRL